MQQYLADLLRHQQQEQKLDNHLVILSLNSLKKFEGNKPGVIESF
jgi:hypothetical protein